MAGGQGEAEYFLANDRKVIASGELITTEETFTGADGKRTYLSIKAPMRDPSGGVVGLIGVSRDITERKQAEQHTHMLLREVSHRAKNMLAVAQAIVRQSARDADPQRYADVLSARLGALGASHDLLVQSEWKSVGMRELVLSQLAHLAALVNDRITLLGPDVRLRPAAAQAIGMALHELATNSQKHGALNGPAGSVKLSWGRLANGARDCFEMQWLESATCSPAASTRRGFGHSVLTRMVEHALDADVVFEITAQGAEWRVSAPSQHVLAGMDGDRVLTQEGSYVRASPDS
jgi:two-component sensor histidine kinase